MSRRGLTVCTLTVLLAVAGCASSSSGTSAPGTTRRLSSTSEAPATTIAATTTTVLATAGEASSDQAAAILVDAWRNDDRVRAAQVADSAAVEGMFATPDPEAWLRGCNLDSEEFGEGRCIYRTETGALTLDTERRGDVWVVVNADWQANDELVTKPPDTTSATTVPPETTTP